MNGIVEVVNDQVVVSSRQIADNFGKEHKDVLYAIREILTAENSAAKFFIESSYSSRGKTFPRVFDEPRRLQSARYGLYWRQSDGMEAQVHQRL